VAETASEAHALPPGFHMGGGREGRIHALGCGHIGGGAYCVWALPPEVGRTAHRHVQVQSHTTALDRKIPQAWGLTMPRTSCSEPMRSSRTSA
jgi:hypothetical protein